LPRNAESDLWPSHLTLRPLQRRCDPALYAELFVRLSITHNFRPEDRAAPNSNYLPERRRGLNRRENTEATLWKQGPPPSGKRPFLARLFPRLADASVFTGNSIQRDRASRHPHGGRTLTTPGGTIGTTVEQDTHSRTLSPRCLAPSRQTNAPTIARAPGMLRVKWQMLLGARAGRSELVTRCEP
jgi:hypothetical protein